MLWSLWAMACGAPLGLLAALALLDDPSLIELEVAAAAGAAVLAAIWLVISRLRDDDPERRTHLARSVSLGLAAAPACGLAWAGLPPRPGWSLAVCAVALAASFYRDARARGPCRPSRVALDTAIVVAGGSVFWIAVSATVAAGGAPRARSGGELTDAIYDFDSRVAPRILPDCPQAVDSVSALSAFGARPRWSVDGRFVWFDAPGREGRRQVFRRDHASGVTRCWTCGQPGNNMRPAPDPMGDVVVFDSDRHADRHHPDNTDLYRMSARGDAPPSVARRLTYDDGPDERALFGPSPAVVVWSRGDGGRYAVVSASISQGHGSVALRSPGVLVAGGAEWTSPLAWSTDARSLLVARGNPFRTLAVQRVDLAKDERTVLAHSVSGLAGAGFNADGGWMAVTSTTRTRFAGVLPAWLGFAVGRFATRAARDGVLFRGTGLLTGPASGPLAAVALGDVAEWGEPTGVAMSPDGGSVILGQRREIEGIVEDRLLEIHLVCAPRAE